MQRTKDADSPSDSVASSQYSAATPTVYLVPTCPLSGREQGGEMWSCRGGAIRQESIYRAFIWEPEPLNSLSAAVVCRHHVFRALQRLYGLVPEYVKLDRRD